MAQNENKPEKKLRKKSSSKTKSYHHGDLKNSVLEAAIKLLRKNGPQSFSIREIALSLGVSSAAPYRHFSSKEKIFAAIAEQGFQVLNQGFEKAIQSHPDDPFEQLHAVGVSYYRFAVKHPEHLQMMFGNIISPDEILEDGLLGMAAGKAFIALVQVVERCQKSGALNEKEDPRMLAILIWSAIHGFAALDSVGTLAGASGLTYKSEDLVKRISKAISYGLKVR